MSRIRVHRDQWGNWLMTCVEHGEDIWTPAWDMAYEAAVGHACLHHPRPRIEYDATGWITDWLGRPITLRTIDATWEKP